MNDELKLRIVNKRKNRMSNDDTTNATKNKRRSQHCIASSILALYLLKKRNTLQLNKVQD